MKKMYEKKTSYNAEKRKRYTYNQNQYEENGENKEIRYKRELIKRTGERILSISGKKLIKTSEESKSRTRIGRNNVIVENAPTKRERNDFFKLLRCNMIPIMQSFRGEDEIFFGINSRSENIGLSIKQKELAHLLGISTVLGSKSQLADVVGKWSTSTTIEKLARIISEKDKIEEVEDQIGGTIINYVKGKEKNKNLFLFDLFNRKKQQVSARKASQEDLERMYAGEFRWRRKAKRR